MSKTRDWKKICLFATLHWFAAIVPSSAYFQASVGGYVFSIPGFNDAERRTQLNAQTWCNGNQSKLLEITSGDIQNSIVSFINYAISQNQMTGNNVITNGKRFNSALIWVNGAAYRTSIEVKNQKPGFINSYGYLGLNSVQSGFDFFVDPPISTRGYMYICEGSYFCASGFTINGRCYKSYSETLSWFDARNRCKDGKGDLASFDFIVDYNGFGALNGSGWNPPSSYWIGIARQKWTWLLSNSDVVYSQWSGGHPDYSTNQNNECLCLLGNYPANDCKWGECDCSQPYQFVCMKESPSSTPPSTSNSAALTSSTTDARGSSSLYPPSSISISGSTLSLSTTSSASTTPENSNMPATSSFKDNSLAIGLGVGIGGGVLLIAVIMVVVFVIVKRKGCPRLARKPRPQKPSSDPPDVTPESYYATVVKNPEFDDTTTDANSNPVIPPPTEYADLNIVTVSPSPDQARRSLV